MSVTHDSWRRSWRELGAPQPDEALFRQLIAAWSEPLRRYHSLQHLRECLELFDAAREAAYRPAEVEIALWFHDAVYDAKRHDNEERSAQWACDAVLAAGLAPKTADSIHALVMATKHDAMPQDPDAKLLVDIDLAILGAAPTRFAESTAQIREEYAHLSDDEWRTGRAAVLRGFLARPCIYSTPPFYAARERQARENLLKSLQDLAGVTG